MQIEIFSVAIAHKERDLKKLNAFLRGQKVLQVGEAFNPTGATPGWTYSVRFLPSTVTPSASAGKEKIDYGKVLDKETFGRYRVLRERRKQIANKHAVAVYLVFNNWELAEIAKLGPEPRIGQLVNISGISQKRAEKYGAELLTTTEENAAS